MFWKITCIKPCKYQQILTFASSFATSQQMLKHWYLQRFWTMIVAKNCYFWSVFPQISCGRYPPNSSKFPKPHFLLTCTYFRGRRHGRNLPMAKATDGLAFGITRHCRIEGLPPMPPTPEFVTCEQLMPWDLLDLEAHVQMLQRSWMSQGIRAAWSNSWDRKWWEEAATKTEIWHNTTNAKLYYFDSF